MEHKDFGVRVDIPNERETVTIEHDQWERVEGVTLKPGYKSTWEKNGAEYFRDRGWREVKPKRWVPVHYEIQREGKTLVAWVNAPAETYPMHFHLDEGYRWKTVEIDREVEG